MLRTIPIPLLLLMTSCGGQSDEERLREAAEQSDPAAAQVLNEAAEQGMDPQEALERAGQAQVQRNLDTGSTVQARPNLPQDPNRPEGGQPPETVDVTEQNRGAAEDEHSGHDMGNSR